jgi:ATP-binding cassette subfamily F protein 3
MLSKDVLKSALLEYGGSLIVVSHDREFLEGLTNKTFEFKNHKIKEYLGDINYFLEKTNLETLQELELNKKNVVQKVEKSSDSQVEREKRKESARNIGKISKQIEVLEGEISDLELKISKIEDFFTSVEFSKHPNTSKNKNEELNSLKKALDKKMSEWSKLEEELEKLKGE